MRVVPRHLGAFYEVFDVVIFAFLRYGGRRRSSPYPPNSASTSASVIFKAPPFSASSTLATNPRFRSFNDSIFSSIVPKVTNRCTNTFLSCPIRCARSVA